MTTDDWICWNQCTPLTSSVCDDEGKYAEGRGTPQLNVTAGEPQAKVSGDAGVVLRACRPPRRAGTWLPRWSHCASTSPLGLGGVSETAPVEQPEASRAALPISSAE